MKTLLLALLLVAPSLALAEWGFDACNACAFASMCPEGTNEVCVPSDAFSDACPSGSYVWTCDPPPPKAVEGTATANYLITHVVYSVPGRGSSMAYAVGDTVGSNLTTEGSFKNEFSVTAGVKEGVLFPSGNFEIAFGNVWETSSGASADIGLSVTNSYRKNGQADFINHNDDEVWFIVRPVFTLRVTPASPYGGPQVEWGMQKAGEGIPFFLYVGELNGTYPMPPGVTEALTRWNFTYEDFDELLKSDLLAPPGPGARARAEGRVTSVPPPPPWSPELVKSMDPARFELLGTFPYKPLTSSGAAASSQSYEVARKEVSGVSSAASTSYSVRVQVGGNFAAIGSPAAFFKVEDKMTFTSKSSRKLSSERNMKNTVTVAQPAFGYLGPTVLRVYMDRIWKTYVFQVDWI